MREGLIMIFCQVASGNLKAVLIVQTLSDGIIDSKSLLIQKILKNLPCKIYFLYPGIVFLLFSSSFQSSKYN